MMKNSIPMSLGHAAGLGGLFLMLAVARLSRPADAPPRGVRQRVTRVMARRAIDAIGGVGWVIDHLPSPRRLQAARSTVRTTPPFLRDEPRPLVPAAGRSHGFTVLPAPRRT